MPPSEDREMLSDLVSSASTLTNDNVDNPVPSQEPVSFLGRQEKSDASQTSAGEDRRSTRKTSKDTLGAVDCLEFFLALPGHRYMDKLRQLEINMKASDATTRQKTRQVFNRLITFASLKDSIKKLISSVGVENLSKTAESTINNLNCAEYDMQNPQFSNSILKKPEQYKYTAKEMFVPGMIGMLPVAQLSRDANAKDLLKTHIADIYLKHHPVLINTVHESYSKGFLLKSHDRAELRKRKRNFLRRCIQVVKEFDDDVELYNRFSVLEVIHDSDFIPMEGCHFDPLLEIEIPHTEAFEPQGSLTSESVSKMHEYAEYSRIKEYTYAVTDYQNVHERAAKKAAAELDSESRRLPEYSGGGISALPLTSQANRLQSSRMSIVNSYADLNASFCGRPFKKRSFGDDSDRTIKRPRYGQY